MEQEQQNSNTLQTGRISNGANGMTVIVKTISSWVKVLIFLFGSRFIKYFSKAPGRSSILEAHTSTHQIS
jgi:hypothetical protein